MGCGDMYHTIAPNRGMGLSARDWDALFDSVCHTRWELENKIVILMKENTDLDKKLAAMKVDNDVLRTLVSELKNAKKVDGGDPVNDAEERLELLKDTKEAYTGGFD